MNDIGMSPDYKSGQHDLITCHVCERAWPGWMVDTCAGCGRPVCMECSEQYESGIACIDCLMEPES